MVLTLSFLEVHQDAGESTVKWEKGREGGSDINKDTMYALSASTIEVMTSN